MTADHRNAKKKKRAEQHAMNSQHGYVLVQNWHSSQFNDVTVGVTRIKGDADGEENA